jgi:hypothetical protein
VYKFDRLEFPKKYPVPNWIKLAVLFLIAAGIGIHNCSQNQLSRDVQISDVKITESSRVHVEVEYTLYNSSSLNRDVWLLLKVYSNKREELGSALYSVSVEANRRVAMLKIIDKLARPIQLNDKPFIVTLEVYQRKVFHNGR